MARTGGTQRVTNVPARSLGGNWRLRDEIILPIPILITFAFIRWIFRHWMFSLSLILSLALSIRFHLHPLAFPLLVIGFFLLTKLFKFLRLYRSHQTIPARGVLKGLFYITRFQKRWVEAARAAKLGHPTSRHWRAPKIKTISIDSPYGTSIKALIDLGQTGNTADDLDRNSDRVLAIMDARSYSIRKLRPGIALLTIDWGARRPSPTDPWHMSNNTFQSPLIDIDVDHLGLALIDPFRSVLIGGEGGSGKSNAIWTMLESLNRLDIPYRVTVIDPAGGVELNDLEGAPVTHRYCDKAANIEPTIAQFYNALQNRLGWMKENHIRKHIPTPERPFEILIVDELLLCPTLTKGGANSLAGLVIASGRKGAYSVWACSQLGQKEVISHIRDLFQQRMCHRTRTEELTDCILGSHATRDGAECHRITDVGQGYIWTDDLKQFVKFQTPHVIHTRSIANGGVGLGPDPLARQKRNWRRTDDDDAATRRNCFTYQLFITDTGTQPDYVGISYNPNKRFRAHSDPRSADHKVWFGDVRHDRTIIECFATKQEAKQRETDLISTYQPRFNVAERMA